MGLLNTLGWARQVRRNAKCYKLDEVAPWSDWASEVGVYFNNLTGPDAPHYFRVGLRSGLGVSMPTHHASKVDTMQEISGGVGRCEPQGDDIVLVVKPRMHSLSVSQVIRVFPASLRHRISYAQSQRGYSRVEQAGRTSRRRSPGPRRR